jgi:uncharacterized protein YceK
MRNILIFAVVASLLVGCSAAKEIRKDNQALTRVYGKPDLLNKAHALWLANNPIVNTPPTIIHGKDSIVYINDTVIVDHVRDSLIKIACPTLNLDSLKKALTKTNTVIHYKTDTLNIIDTSCARLYNQKVAENNYLTGQSNVKDRQLTDNKDEIRKLKLQRAIGAIIAGLLIIFFGYLLIKRK